MCIEISHNQFNKTASNKKVSLSIRKLIQQFFKHHKSHGREGVSSETFENELNASLESEKYENDINERLCSKQSFEAEDFASPSIVPVHFAHTAQGTLFWTISTNNYDYNQMNHLQDRWAQA
uniref:Uncharacterized protein n=1 Tax=Stomoxys calcitrans TaxID=35570 RepID=A0A1I8PRU2_STOCA